MNEPVKYAVILVYSISHAIRIEGMLKKEGINARMIPVPRHLSSDCGSTVRIPGIAKENCEKLLRECNIEFIDIVDLDR